MRTLNANLLLAISASCLLAGCPSPVNDEAIDALGGECSGVPESEFHRRGQPCVLCHDGYEAASPKLSIAGTIFETPDSPTPRPVGGAKITIVDASGDSRSATSNCIGNFMIDADDWVPAYPLHAELICPPPPGSDKSIRLVMGTRIGRDGSCASCHKGPRGIDSPGWIYCSEEQVNYKFDQSCPGLCEGERVLNPNSGAQ